MDNTTRARNGEEVERLPSIVSRMALRLALVFAIQVIVLGLLVFAMPRFFEALGEQIVTVRRDALTEFLEERGRHLGEVAALAASQAPDEAKATALLADGPCRGGRCSGLVLRQDGSIASADAQAVLPSTLGGELVRRLAEREALGEPVWATYLHQGQLFLAGGARLSTEAGGNWLVLAEAASNALQGLANDVTFVADGDTGQVARPLTYSAMVGGRLDMALLVPNVVGAQNIIASVSVPVPRLGQLLRAGSLILAASLFLLAGTLSLFFVTAYIEVMRPFRTRVEAIREYARTGTWKPPKTGFREHETASQAMTEAVRAREAAEARAQQHLRELRAFIDNLPALAAVKDADLKLLMANDALAKTYGLPTESLLGKTDSELMPEQLARVGREHDLQVLREKRPLQFEEEWTAGGQTRLYRVAKAPILDQAGEVAGLISVGIDITEQKALQSRLVEAQKMQVVGRLAGGLCHAFNNLLTTIIGSAELALLSMDEDYPARPDVQQVRDTAERGAALSRQLLVLGRQRLGRVEPVDFTALVGELTPVLQETLGEGILLEVSAAPTLPKVRADATQWRQALINLALNAREAMPQGGVFRVETLVCRPPREALALEPALQLGPVVCLSVQDTGVGLADEARQHLFEPFYTTKGMAKGRGLGLPVVYSIVRQHSGAILFESEEGKGTAFMVYLPGVVSEPAAEQQEQAAALPAPVGSETVLLVEDDLMVRRLAERMLTAQGYRVSSAGSGEEALSLVSERGEPPNLLLSDVIMPGMTGIELARRMQKQYPDLRILLMSGYAGENDDDTMEGFPILWKPFTLQVLAQRVRTALDL